jgi:pSer/pThr/pTyr-binding forkhead associated (FHA) protein
MPKLILSMDGLVLKEIELDKERISIGRRSTNDIQIDNLAISGEHAVITCILDDAFLEDRNSTNGTYVNGQPVKKHVLRNNDIIELGKYRLKFLTGTSPGRLAAAEMVDAAALKPFELPPVAAEAAPAAGETVRTQVGPTPAGSSS